MRVKVQSTYRPVESAPKLSQYFFSYHITVTNESESILQLKSRHWVIKDANGKVEEVR